MDTHDTGLVPTAGPTGPTLESDLLYHAVVTRHAEGLYARASDTLSHGGAIDEPGLLRLVLARLLTNEPEPARLAARAADLANAVARLQAIQRQAQGDASAQWPNAMKEVQKDLDAARDRSTLHIPLFEGDQP